MNNNDKTLQTAERAQSITQYRVGKLEERVTVIEEKIDKNTVFTISTLVSVIVAIGVFLFTKHI